MTNHAVSSRRFLLLLFTAVALFAVDFVRGFAQNTNHSGGETNHIHHHHYAEFAKVPEKARARPNPLGGDPEAVLAGRKLFEQHCAECHGNAAQGGRRAPSLRAEDVQHATPGALFWILTNGVVRRGMPVWSKLPEPERWQIITFVKSLPPPHGTSDPLKPRENR